MKKEEERFAPSTVFEGITSVSAVINSILSGISDRKIIRVLFDKERESHKRKELDFLRHRAAEMNFEITPTTHDEITAVTTGNSHGGIIAECTSRSYPKLTESNISLNGFYIMLEGIEDPYNFGYALRTIFASGANGVILSGRNWFSAAGVVCRASAGASELIPSYISESEDAIHYFKNKNYKIVAAGIRDSVRHLMRI